MMKFISLFLLICPALALSQNSSTYGGVFTPRGDLHVLIIYAGFSNSFSEEHQSQEAWPENDRQSSLPPYINPKNGLIPDLLYSDTSKFEDASDSILNLSRFYYDMSMGAFRMTGEVLKNPRTGKPVRLNIDPTADHPDFDKPARSWGDCNHRVLHQMRKQFPDFDWSPFDLHKNSPRFEFDASRTGPDGKPDFIIIMYRHSKQWRFQPLPGMNRWSGSGGGFSVLSGIPSSFEFNGYRFDNAGFTQPEGGFKAQKIQKYMEHEIAHELFGCPHVMGANGAAGRRWHFPSSGYGMMTSWTEINKTSNAWERWLLGWVELTTGEDTVGCDIQSEGDLVNNGIYTLRDYTTTGDVIRIKIPHTEDQFLWIENHQKVSPFDENPWKGKKISKDGEQMPAMDAGVFMYVENVISDRSAMRRGIVSDMNRVNGIKLLNAQGNYDYEHSETAPTPSWDYLWRNTLFIFQRGEENPISGINPYWSFPDDFPTKADIPGSDGKILYRNHFNGGNNESYKIARETNGKDTRLLLGHLGGRNKEAIELFDRRSPAFQPGDEVSLSGIIPVLNFPMYNKGRVRHEPYILNGLNITFLSQSSNGDITVQVRFDDFELRENKRWCGPMILKAQQDSVQKPSLVLAKNVQLRIDKSKIPNRHIKTKAGDFIEPSVLLMEENTLVKMENKAELIIENGSKVILRTGAILDLEEKATIIIEEGSELILEKGAALKANEHQIVIEDGGKLIDHNFEED